LENVEALEQLRVLWCACLRVCVCVVCVCVRVDPNVSVTPTTCRLSAPAHRVGGHATGSTAWMTNHTPRHCLMIPGGGRRLRYGEKIHVAVAANDPPAGVDTQEDLDRVREFVRAHAV